MNKSEIIDMEVHRLVPHIHNTRLPSWGEDPEQEERVRALRVPERDLDDISLPPRLTKWDFVKGGLFAAFLTVLLCIGSCNVGQTFERGEAVRAGVGRYEADPRTGHTKFVYSKW